MGHGEADLALRLAALPVVPPAHLPVVAAAGQQVPVLGVELARHQVVGGRQVQQRLRGVLCVSIIQSWVNKMHFIPILKMYEVLGVSGCRPRNSRLQ